MIAKENRRKIFIHLLFIQVFCVFAINAHATPWYVDSNNTNDRNDGKSWDTAWHDSNDIAWDSILPGATIYFAKGVYPPLAIGTSGSDEKPIRISAAQDDGYIGQAVFSGNNGVSLSMGSHKNIIIDGEYDGSRNLRFTDSSDDQDGACIKSTSGDTENWTFRYIEVDDCGIGLIDPYVAGLEVEYSYFHDIRGDAAISITCYRNCSASDSWGANRIHHNEIQVNHAVTNDGSGPDGIQGGTGVDFYNNKIYGDIGTVYGSQHQDLIQAQNRYWRIYNNSFRNSADSCIDFDLFTPELTRWEHIWIYNNTFENSLPASEWRYPQSIRAYSTGGEAIEAIDDVLIANNTFTDLLFTHLRIRFSNPHITNTAIKNNIFYNTGKAPDSKNNNTDDAPNSFLYLAASDNATALDWNFDHNLIHSGQSGSGFAAIDNDCPSNASCTPSDRYTQANDLTGEPQFMHYSEKGENNDLHLSNEDTAAREQGSDLSHYFTTDKNGKDRTGAWDVGAYESGSEKVPSPPTNLIIADPVEVPGAQ